MLLRPIAAKSFCFSLLIEPSVFFSVCVQVVPKHITLFFKDKIQ